MEYEKDRWQNRKTLLMALFCLNIGNPTFITMPNIALEHGATGYTLGFALVYIFIGIPLLYMEFIIGQFTTRDCVSVWNIRPFLSHIGYIQISMQVFMIIYNHTVATFILHYFITSFENPVPYYFCGRWSTENCDILTQNYSLHRLCLVLKPSSERCQNLYISFPEHQYWRYYVLGGHTGTYFVAWRVCLSSAIVCIIIYLCCFKKIQSLKCILMFFAFYPTLGFIIIMVGSMLQKGLVVKYDEAMDVNFSNFQKNFNPSYIIRDVLYALNIGTGISFNLGASAAFRSPCYANIVIITSVCAAFIVLAICTVGMMACPYAYEYSTTPQSILKVRNMSYIFEKIPRLLSVYENKNFYLITCFSSLALLSLSSNTIIIYSLIEMFAAKISVVDRYPGLITLGVTTVLFIVTIPLLGTPGIYTIYEFRQFVQYVTIFMAMLESLVFVVCYGLAKFSEDVHFMQGIQPSSFMKLSWISSIVVLAFVFCSPLVSMYNDLTRDSSIGYLSGWWTLLALILTIIGGGILKIIIAACKHKFGEVVKMSSQWGPSSDILRRSRAMFTAQAMTKEYMYRQYHLQAGILARQQSSNVRNPLRGRTSSRF